MITIPITDLHHHPDNPRKEYGDLGELTASIEANGVMQNLVVVPIPDNLGKPDNEPQYYVVAGNRRLEAAKAAKLEHLPCAVHKLSRAEQIGMMLAENMQRNDLTVYEQAQGIQMMLDLGESEKTISAKTGLSKSTVKQRVKLLAFDQGKFEQAVARGARLEDFAEIEKLESAERRNEVLEAVGTPNFQHRLMRALDDEKVEKALAKVREKLGVFAKEIPSAQDHSKRLALFKHIDVLNYKPKDLQPPDDAETREYVFTFGRWVAVYMVCDEDSADAAQTDKYERHRLKRQAEGEVASRAFRLRKMFIKHFPGGKKLAGAVNEFAVFVLTSRGYMSPMDPKLFSELLGIDPPKGNVIQEAQLKAAREKNPERVLAVAAYAKLSDSERNNCCTWQGDYQRNKTLDAIYGHLANLGYTISDEERAWLSGEHECFQMTADAAPDQANTADPAE